MSEPTPRFTRTPAFEFDEWHDGPCTESMEASIAWKKEDYLSLDKLQENCKPLSRTPPISNPIHLPCIRLHSESGTFEMSSSLPHTPLFGSKKSPRRPKRESDPGPKSPGVGGPKSKSTQGRRPIFDCGYKW